MPYTLYFSNPAKSNTVVVPDMPPGINSVDTSLSFVGRGYPNYGQKFAENFLHLLENFANNQPPANPIEGQLWYDTSDPTNKVLRVMDGNSSSIRWASATGIYQQNTDPTGANSLKIGDIWVDTSSNQLRIYNGGDWTTVGPQIANSGVNGQATASTTGAYPDSILDNANTAVAHPVIKNYVNGTIISIISKDSFTPASTLLGFESGIKPGINLSSASTYTFIGPAQSAENLLVNGQAVGSSNFLRKDNTGEIITGSVIWQMPSSEVNYAKKDGIVMYRNGDVATDYVQITKLGNNAVILNNTRGGQIRIQQNPLTGGFVPTVVAISSDLVTVNAGLTVNGIAVVNTLSVASTLTVGGSVSIASNESVGGNLNVTGITTTTGKLYVGADILPKVQTGINIGSQTAQFNSIYAQRVGTQYVPPQNYNTWYFTVATSTNFYNVASTSSISLNTGLQTWGLNLATVPADFSVGTRISANYTLNPAIALQGTITNITTTGITINVDTSPTTSTVLSTYFYGEFYGNLYGHVNGALTANAVGPLPTVYSANTSMNVMVLDTGTHQLSQLAHNVTLPGTVTAYASNTSPSGWLLCNGSTYNTSTYSSLYSVLSSSTLPNISDLSSGIKYIIKT